MTRPSPSTCVSKTWAPTGSTIAILGTDVYPWPAFNILILVTSPFVKFALKAALIGFVPVGSSI